MSEDNNLPETIKQQVEDALRLQKEMYGGQGQDPDTSSEQAPDPAQAAGSPSESSFENAAQGSEHDQGTPEVRDAAYWEKRFRSYKGQTDRTLYEERQTIKQLQAQISALNGQLEAASKILSELSAKQKADPRAFLPQEVVDNLGEDTATDVAAVARAVAEKITAEKNNEINALKKTVSTLVESKTVERKTSEVASILTTVGEMNGVSYQAALAIDQDTSFHRWLETNRDPYSGRTFMELYHNAGSSGDTIRVAALQREWTQTKKPVQGKQAFENKVAPDRSRGNVSTGESGEKRIWTGADIQEFYKLKLGGKIDPAKATELENDIFLAQKEGRVFERKRGTSPGF